jgi:hypothetical protein
MARDAARVHLVFECATRRSAAPRELAQLFYRLEVLYGATVASDSLPRPGSWLEGELLQTWQRHLGKEPAETRIWPLDPPLPPPLGQDTQLVVESVVMTSPLEIALLIPAAALSAAGAFGIFRFIAAIERAWNAPRRIRLEGLQLDRAILEAEAAKQRAWEELRSRRFPPPLELSEGVAQLPDSAEWDWPSSPSID